MIEITNVDMYGFEHAIRAMRNPMNSWDKSDTEPHSCNLCGTYQCENCAYKSIDTTANRDCIGKNDLTLMQKLNHAGVEHRTYARMIQVWCDVNAPLYWWKEADRYRMGKEQISTSTMHKLHTKEFTLDDFSVNYLDANSNTTFLFVINKLNECRDTYNTLSKRLKSDKTLTDQERKHLTGMKKYYWYQMIQLLPSSYNQKRTCMFSYETLLKIYRERKNHKLDEWVDFCKWCEKLPYFKEILGQVQV